MKKRKLKKGAWQKITVVFLTSIVVAYIISALLYVLAAGVSIKDALMDYQSVFNFLQTTNSQNLLIVSVLSFLFLGWFLKTTDIFEKTYEDASSHGVHGQGRMGTVDEYIQSGIISKRKHAQYDPKDYNVALSAEEGIILARDPKKNNLIIVPNDSKANNRNVIVVGSPGSAKGQGYVLTNLINNRTDTIITTDPKGELHRDTAQLKRDQGFAVFQIDFLDFMQSGHNPLDYVFSDIDAQKVSMTMAKNSTEDGKFDFFMERAQKMLQGLITYCKGINPKANMNDVVEVFNDYVNPDIETFSDFVENDVGKGHEAYHILKGLTSLTSNTRSSVLSNFSSVISIFQINMVNRMTRTSDFNFYDFQKQKSILYVKIPMRKNPFQAITATFFDQLIDAFYSIADKQPDGKLPIKATFLLDEFQNIGRLNGYEETLATCRGLNISMQTIIQDLAKMELLYKKEGVRSIVSNHAIRLFLKTGDPETAKYFSSLTEPQTVKYNTGGISEPGGLLNTKGKTSVSENEQYQKKELISAGRLANLADDECFILSSEANPIHAKKAFQYIIYKGFLFDKKRKPCYEKNRKRYIKDFHLTPYEIETSENQEIERQPEVEVEQDKQMQDEYEENKKPENLSDKDFSDEDEDNDHSDELTEEELSMLYGNQDNEEPEVEQEERGESITSELQSTLDEIESELDDLDTDENEIDQEALDDAINEIAEDDDTEENQTEDKSKVEDEEDKRKEDTTSVPDELPM
ncbi:VirD4-like conjugal transfer protein, CD1115 family [Halobacillus amylolyticus]|uniref:Type IV secretory system conjugative DNA transfer family protein n=1 Tax=Halobacillus amylolyticus TaxID=2932259 RepID=A0ABY4HH71_9BACI|nr:type IV secretory system conjugative DNA transfer family protein [Halobacillus amylolyticus]UOR14099.1 type IV secretory system conjugative DNA transfer family protein [Halobacillus amylolyticus]